MVGVGNSGTRTLGKGMGCITSTDSKNQALFRGVRDVVHGKGRGDSALVYLVSAEGQRKRALGPVMHQVGPDIRWKMHEEGSTQEETSLMVGRKEGEHLQHQGRG